MGHADQDATAPSRRLLAARLGSAALGALALEYVPSVVALGQWGPLHALPWELCRWQGPRFPPQVALTFDDGPDPEGTPAILDRLDALGAKGTFFVLGAHVDGCRALVEDIVGRGHAVGTHGYEHAHHLVRGPRWVRHDLERAVRALRAVGVDPVWYRPSYGQATAATLFAARALGLRTVLWSAWGREWATGRAERVASRIARRLRPGAIVLLHDSDRVGPAGMWRRAAQALTVLGAELTRRALRAVTLDELVAHQPAPGVGGPR